MKKKVLTLTMLSLLILHMTSHLAFAAPYYNEKSGVSFNIPMGFTSTGTEETTLTFAESFQTESYDSIDFNYFDVWENLSTEDKKTSPRSDINNNSFTEEELLQVFLEEREMDLNDTDWLTIANTKVEKENVNKIQYFKITINYIFEYEDEKLHFTEVLNILFYNGHRYVFIYTAFEENFDDSIRLNWLNSVIYDNITSNIVAPTQNQNSSLPPLFPSATDIMISLLVTLFAYTLIPSFIILAMKNNYEASSKKLVFWIAFANSAIISILFIVWREINGVDIDNPSYTFTPAFIWFFIVKWLLTKFLIENKLKANNTGNMSFFNSNNTKVNEIATVLSKILIVRFSDIKTLLEKENTSFSCYSLWLKISSLNVFLLHENIIKKHGEDFCSKVLDLTEISIVNSSKEYLQGPILASDIEIYQVYKDSITKINNFAANPDMNIVLDNIIETVFSDVYLSDTTDIESLQQNIGALISDWINKNNNDLYDLLYKS